jgi:PAS domain S-box-containing protein
VANKKDEYSRDDVDALTALGGKMWEIFRRKRSEEALTRSEEQYRRLVENMNEGLWVLDREGGTVFVNARMAEMLGYTVGEMQGRPLFDFMDEAGVRIARKKLEQREAGIAEQHDFEFLRKDGSRLYALLGASPIMDSDGSYRGSVAAVLDITGRRQAEEEKVRLEEHLHQAVKMESVGRLAGGVAHDFNNLLTGIIGNLSLILSDLDPGDPLHGTLTEVNNAAESAATLTRQLLAFSRKQVVQPRVINLNEMVAGQKMMLARLIGENIRLKTVLAEGLWAVKVDPPQTEQVFINLVVNARDAMPDGGELVVQTANVELGAEYGKTHPYVTPGGYVKLSVSDTGQGISEEVRSHLFEPFFTTKKMGRGTGLGLATSYGVIKQSGGHIEVDSREGSGTTFIVYLPKVDEKPAGLTGDVGVLVRSGGGQTILVVEDEPMVRDLAVRILERTGYTVLVAEDAEKALDVAGATSGPIDLLLTDVMMPGINGRELADRLKKTRPEMNVLFASGYSEDVLEERGADVGMLNFIGKPYTPRTLAKKVREVLEKT